MYKKLYFMMFNRMTDAVNAPKEGRNDDALRALQGAQEEAEQIFIENGEDGKKNAPCAENRTGDPVCHKKQKPPLCQVTVLHK